LAEDFSKHRVFLTAETRRRRDGAKEILDQTTSVQGAETII
jgi:hypothetical protein